MSKQIEVVYFIRKYRDSQNPEFIPIYVKWNSDSRLAKVGAKWVQRHRPSFSASLDRETGRLRFHFEWPGTWRMAAGAILNKPWVFIHAGPIKIWVRTYSYSIRKLFSRFN